MIDLTPLDVRNKRGDFKKIMRGYDPEQVDVFLEIVADRLEVLVRETLHLRERTQALEEQVSQQSERERAVQDALVSAQGLRADIEAQSQREAEHILREAQGEAKQLLANAEAEVRRMLLEADEEVRNRLRGIERRVDQASTSLEELERGRIRFLKEFASLLDREREVVRVELDRTPFDERAIDMDLGGRVGIAAEGVATLGARASDVGDAVDGAGSASESGETPLSEADEAADDDESSPLDASVDADEEVDADVTVDGAADDADTAPTVDGDADDEDRALAHAREDSAPDAEPEVVFEPGLPVSEVVVDESGPTVPDQSAPTLEELKAEMEATLGLGVMAVPIAPDEAPLRAEGISASPPPLPDPAPTVDEPDGSAASTLATEPEVEIEAASGMGVSDHESHAEDVEVLETGPVDPTPETWSEPVSTLELAPDLPMEEARPEEMNGADAPVDVTSLSPEPSGLEGGLAALDTRGSRGAGPFEGVPDLETVLAEAGIEEVVPPPLDESTSRSIGGERDNLILFEPEDHDRGR